MIPAGEYIPSTIPSVLRTTASGKLDPLIFNFSVPPTKDMANSLFAAAANALVGLDGIPATVAMMRDLAYRLENPEVAGSA